MPAFEPSVTDYDPFWKWLKREARAEGCFELWLGTHDLNRLRPPMVKPRDLLSVAWTGAVTNAKVPLHHGLPFLRTASNQYLKERTDADTFDPSDSVVGIYEAKLEEVLAELHTKWRLKVDADDQDEVEDVAVVKKRLDQARKRQRDVLGRHDHGLFWATTKAADGDAFIVFSSGPTSRPPPTAIAMAKGATQAGSVPTASGSWATDGTTLYLTRTAGDLGPVAAWPPVVGMPVSLQAPRTKGPELDVKRLRGLAGTAKIEAGRGKEGFFYFVPALGAPPKPCFILTKARSNELSTHLAEVDSLFGSWSREGNLTTLTLLGTASVDRAQGEALAKHVRSTKVFGMLGKVDVVGKGLKLLDLKAISSADRKGKPTAFAARRRTALEASRKVAATGAGNLWFARHAGDDASLVVLYGERGFPYDKKVLLSSDAAKAAMVMEAEWQVTKSPRGTELKPARAGAPLVDELKKRLLADKLLPAPITVVQELDDAEVDFAPLRRQITAANRRAAANLTGNLWFTVRAADQQPLLVLYRDRQLPHDAADLLGPKPPSSSAPVVARWERDAKAKVVKVTLLATAPTAALKRVLDGLGIFPERTITFA